MYNPDNREYLERESEPIRELISLYRNKSIEAIEKRYAGRGLLLCYELLDHNWRVLCRTEVFDTPSDNAVCFRKVIRRIDKPGRTIFRHIRDDSETFTLDTPSVRNIAEIIKANAGTFRAEGYHADEGGALDGFCCDVILSDCEDTYYFEKVDLWHTVGGTDRLINQPVGSLLKEIFSVLEAQGVPARYYEQCTSFGRYTFE